MEARERVPLRPGPRQQPGLDPCRGTRRLRAHAAGENRPGRRDRRTGPAADHQRGAELAGGGLLRVLLGRSDRRHQQRRNPQGRLRPRVQQQRHATGRQRGPDQHHRRIGLLPEFTHNGIGTGAHGHERLRRPRHHRCRDPHAERHPELRGMRERVPAGARHGRSPSCVQRGRAVEARLHLPVRRRHRPVRHERADLRVSARPVARGRDLGSVDRRLRHRPLLRGPPDDAGCRCGLGLLFVPESGNRPELAEGFVSHRGRLGRRAGRDRGRHLFARLAGHVPRRRGQRDGPGCGFQPGRPKGVRALRGDACGVGRLLREGRPGARRPVD